MNSAEPAPVALFAYRRPRHLEAVLAALARNDLAEQTPLHVFCDGPKEDSHREGVAEVRALARAARGFARVQVVEREANAGLARSIIEGVTTTVATNGRVIVVEDDLVTSPYFLRYMNDGLAHYATSSEVASIHAYAFPVRTPLPETFFLRGSDCWGWATWARAWKVFEPDGTKLLAALRSQGLTRLFDFDGTYGYTRMLEDQIAGRNDSWAVRWYASAFLTGMLTLYPGRSLVRNIGNEGSGTHTLVATDAFESGLATTPVQVGTAPLCDDVQARAEFGGFFRRLKRRMFLEGLLAVAKRPFR